MIEVKVLYNKKHKLIGFEASGHANSGPYGKDLVCAGVSSIITGGLNNIQDQQTFEITLFEGYSKVKPWFSNDKINRHDQIVLETIVTQLKTIEQAHPKNIKVNNTCIE